MAQRVYIETTVVSYLTARPNRDVVIAGHQQVTHEWWDTRRANYELCVSQLVLDEAGAGDALPKSGYWCCGPCWCSKRRRRRWSWRRNCFRQERCQQRRP